jgi:hypothetical protein
MQPRGTSELPALARSVDTAALADQIGGNGRAHRPGLWKLLNPRIRPGRCRPLQHFSIRRACVWLLASSGSTIVDTHHWSARTTLLALGLQASDIAGCKMHTSAQRGSSMSSRDPLKPIRIQRQQGHHCQTRRLSELMMMKRNIAVLVSLSVVLVTMMAPAASAMASHTRRQLAPPPPPQSLVWPSTSASSPPSLPSSSSSSGAAEVRKVAGSVLPPALTVRAFAFSHSVPGVVPDAADDVGAAIAMLAMSPPVVDSHGAWSASGGQ